MNPSVPPYYALFISFHLLFTEVPGSGLLGSPHTRWRLSPPRTDRSRALTPRPGSPVCTPRNVSVWICSAVDGGTGYHQGPPDPRLLFPPPASGRVPGP